MKEYLLERDGKYELHKGGIVPDGAIEVPEGADTATKDSANIVYFWKDAENKTYVDGEGWLACDDKWTVFLKTYIKHNDASIIWHRFTQPEELPFVDDEPSIETATGYQLDNIGNSIYGSRSRKEGESDISYRQYLMNLIIENRGKSLNDQYAEIEQVRQTLNERAAQYGSFVGVANTTGQLMAVILNSPNGHALPYAHKEALHMIASKIARIVNGNYNHKDSWHDIQGYAKLIEDLIG